MVTSRSERRAIMVDITVLHDENLVNENQFKYLNLDRKVVYLWGVSTVIVPIIVSANSVCQ